MKVRYSIWGPSALSFLASSSASSTQNIEILLANTGMYMTDDTDNDNNNDNVDDIDEPYLLSQFSSQDAYLSLKMISP